MFRDLQEIRESKDLLDLLDSRQALNLMTALSYIFLFFSHIDNKIFYLALICRDSLDPKVLLVRLASLVSR